MKYINNFLRAFSVVTILSFLYAVIIERRWYKISYDEVKALKGHHKPIRVALFSDLHLRPNQDHRLQFLLDSVIDEQPDLIISAGDNLESNESISAVIEAHQYLLENCPNATGIVTLGAHDRFGPSPKLNPFRYFAGPSSKNSPNHTNKLDFNRLVSGLRDAGWIVPINGQVEVQTRSGIVNISVVDDAHIDKDELSKIHSIPTKSSENPDKDYVLSLGITHAPYRRVLDKFVSVGVDLMLAGHTHGGQVCIPFYGALVTNSDLPPKKARGLSYINQVPLIVTAGLGHSTYAPFRFACRPEIRIIDIE